MRHDKNCAGVLRAKAKKYIVSENPEEDIMFGLYPNAISLNPIFRNLNFFSQKTCE
jgi:hypothetical protein